MWDSLAVKYARLQTLWQRGQEAQVQVVEALQRHGERTTTLLDGMHGGRERVLSANDIARLNWGP